MTQAAYKSDSLLRQSDPPSIYDNTMLVMSDGCKRKLYWWLRGLRMARKPAYFSYGSAWQTGLEVYYATQGTWDERYAAAKQAALRAWDDEAPEESKNDKRSNLEYALTWYCLTYSREPWSSVVLRGESMELGFTFPLHGTSYLLGGAIDGYLTWEPHGQLLLENKTTGMNISEGFMYQWAFSSQVTQYIWALSQILAEWPFGAVLNVASKNITQKAVAAFQKKGEIPDGMFTRQLEKRSPFQIQRFEQHCRLQIEDILREWDRWLWPMTRDQQMCAGGIGKSKCEYRRLCLAEIPFTALEQPEGDDLKYTTISWEPWERGFRKEERENGRSKGEDKGTGETSDLAYSTSTGGTREEAERTLPGESSERKGTSLEELLVESPGAWEHGDR